LVELGLAPELGNRTCICAAEKQQLVFCAEDKQPPQVKNRHPQGTNLKA